MVYASFDLSGKVAIVTGGNRGIGLGIVRGFAEAGAGVVVAARNEEKSRQVVREIQEEGGEALAANVDVGDESSVQALMQSTLDRFGRLDILVNNAGINIRKTPEKLTLPEWSEVLQINLTGTFLCSQAAYPAMKSAGGGKIINIGSMLSLFGASFSPAYGASKGGVVQLTKSLAKLTVIDNVLLGAPGQAGERLWTAPFRWRWRDQERENTGRAEELLERFNLAHMRDELAGTLSGGQRKLLEVARALMANPVLIMLDEPMAGVNPALGQSLMRHITLLAHEGMSVVFIEHAMDVVTGLSDWVVVLSQGRIIAEGPPWKIIHDDDVIDAYLGRRRAGDAL